MLMFGASSSAPPGTFQTPGDSEIWNPLAKLTSVPLVTSIACSFCTAQQNNGVHVRAGLRWKWWPQLGGTAL